MLRSNILFEVIKRFENNFKNFKVISFLADEKGNGTGLIKTSDGEECDFKVNMRNDLIITFFDDMSEDAFCLRERMKTDSCFETVSKKDLKIIGYLPEDGYNSWLFQYKNSYVLCYDDGNGWYSFGREIHDISKLYIDRDITGYGKYNTEEELKECLRINNIFNDKNP